MRKCAAVVLAAGLGTRMKSEKAKVLHEMAGLPMVFYPVQTAAKLKMSPIVVIVGHQGKIVEKELRQLMPKADLRFVTQRRQLGTGHAVKQAKKELADFDGDLLILYGDVPLISQQTVKAFKKLHTKSEFKASVISIFLDNPTGYGRMLLTDDDNLVRIVEEKDATAGEKKIKEVNSGIYLVDSKTLFKYIGKVKKKNVQGEYYLTDAISMIAEKDKVGVIPLDEPTELTGINNRVDLAYVTGELRYMINDYWMRMGVTMHDPESTYIDAQVVIGPDSVLGPDVHLLGNTKIGEKCIIEAGSHIRDSVLSAGVHVKPYSVFEKAKVKTGSVIGPFSRIRPGTTIGEQCKVGNFVEMKKVTTGKNTKVSHLTYLGDAKLGSDINIGAGTITCNYDGVNKHLTVIGDGAFIGSDSQLVAPVKVGKGAYIGSGSTITDDVPAQALAVARGRQFVRKGYAKAFMKKAKKAKAKKNP